MKQNKSNTFNMVFILAIISTYGSSCINNDQVASPNKVTISENPWHKVSLSKLANVSVERSLYEESDNAHFFVKIRILNISSKMIFVDLRGYSKVIYPNQWGVLRTDHRQEISERRRDIGPLNKTERLALLEAFRKNELTAIPIGKSIEYYREFNASRRSDIDKQVASYKNIRWIFISMDGELLFTDGQIVEQVRCTMGNDNISTDLVLSHPINWKKIPKEGIIIGESSMETRKLGGMK